MFFISHDDYSIFIKICELIYFYSYFFQVNKRAMLLTYFTLVFLACNFGRLNYQYKKTCLLCPWLRKQLLSFE